MDDFFHGKLGRPPSHPAADQVIRSLPTSKKPRWTKPFFQRAIQLPIDTGIGTQASSSHGRVPALLSRSQAGAGGRGSPAAATIGRWWLSAEPHDF